MSRRPSSRAQANRTISREEETPPLTTFPLEVVAVARERYRNSVASRESTRNNSLARESSRHTASATVCDATGVAQTSTEAY